MIVYTRDVFFGLSIRFHNVSTFSFLSVLFFLSQLALGGCVECVMLSVTRD